MKKALAILLLLLTLTSCTSVGNFFGYDKSVKENFLTFYDREMTLDEFCGSENEYNISVQVNYSEVALRLKKESGEWSGELRLYQKDPKTSITEIVEEIPVSVFDNKITLHSNTEKEVPLNVLFLYNFNVQNCNVTKSFVETIDYPLEEVRGDYPLEEIQSYMELFYDEIISCLMKFDEKDAYFSAIESLQQFVYIKNNTHPDNPTHLISFGFDGGTDIKQFYPNFGSFENITLLLIEDGSIGMTPIFSV